MEHVAFVRVKLTCNDDAFAYGEAPATKAITGEDLENIVTSIASVKRSVDWVGTFGSFACITCKCYRFKRKSRT